MLIDDFITGPHTATLASGIDASYQIITANPDFPIRSTWFWISSLPSNQPGTIDVGSSGLTVGTGPHVYHRLQVGYGYLADGSPNPLDSDLSEFAGFRVNFDFIDLTLNFNIVFFSDSGAVYSQAGQNIGASFVPSSVDFPFTQFVGAANSSDVDFIVLVAQTGTYGGGNDYKVRSFEAYQGS